MGTLMLITKPLGLYMAGVYEGKPIILDRVFGPAERLFYRLCGTSETEEQNWQTYALAVILFNMRGVIIVYVLQRFQGSLPLNPQHFGAISPPSSFNTATRLFTN